MRRIYAASPFLALVITLLVILLLADQNNGGVVIAATATTNDNVNIGDDESSRAAKKNIDIENPVQWSIVAANGDSTLPNRSGTQRMMAKDPTKKKSTPKTTKKPGKKKGGPANAPTTGKDTYPPTTQPVNAPTSSKSTPSPVKKGPGTKKKGKDTYPPTTQPVNAPTSFKSTPSPVKNAPPSSEGTKKKGKDTYPPTTQPVNAPTSSKSTPSPVKNAPTSSKGTKKKGKGSKNSSPPTFQPVNAFCEDDADWKLIDDNTWGQPHPLKGMNCSALAALAPDDESGTEDWCDYLNQDTLDVADKCAAEACCFCGGGKSQKIPCKNIEDWRIDDKLGCDFIENSAEPEYFCEIYEDYQFKGIKTSEACCICGGGVKPVNVNNAGDEALIKEARTRRLDIDFRDWTTRVGLGESGGIPNLEYLGLGYDIVFGNPRGSETSELDPGFRHRVVRLIQKQTDLTVDGEFTVPLGTTVKYTSSCTYDSKSTQIANELEFRNTMEKEVSTSQNSSTKSSSGINLFIINTSSSLEKKSSFSSSTKFKAYQETNVKTNNVSFEARAICSEFEASFNPYAEQVLDAEFESALGDLPVPYNRHNKNHIFAYSKFLTAYGTHYLKQVTLGGKRIFTTSMSSSDYTSLKRERVDVEGSMTFEVQQGMSSSLSVKAGMVKGVLGALGPKGKAAATIVNVISGGDDDTELFGINGKSSSSSGNSVFTSSTQQAEAVEKLSSVQKLHSEVTIGGDPNVDWRAWAATIREKPMPVTYEITGLWDLMNYQQTVAFFDALVNIYDLDLTDNASQDVFEAFKFGVYSGSGKPLTKFSLNPNAYFRILLEGGLAKKAEEKDETQGNVTRRHLSDEQNCELGKSTKFEVIWPSGAKISWIGKQGFPGDYHGACGVVVSTAVDGGIMNGFKLLLCGVNNYHDVQVKDISNVPAGVSSNNHVRFCKSKGSFITGMQLKQNVDDFFILGMRIYCSGSISEIEIFDDNGGNSSSSPTSFSSPQMIPELTCSPADGPVQNVITGGFVPTSAEITGITGIKLMYKGIKMMQDVEHAEYFSTWGSKSDLPYAILASPIRGIVNESPTEESEYGFVSNGVVDFQNNVPFGRSEDAAGAGILKLTAFSSNSTFQAFSLMVSDNLEGLSEDGKDLVLKGKIISGVITSDGRIANDRFSFNPADNLEIGITKVESNFNMILSNATFQGATVVATPHFYAENGATYPQNIGDLSITLSNGGPASPKFAIRAGLAGSDVGESLGYNFVAVARDSAESLPPVKHGIINIVDSGSDEQREVGLVATPLFGPTMTSFSDGLTRISGPTGGVSITFDDPQYIDIPSVFVTPVDRDDQCSNISFEKFAGPSLAVPWCIVETVTKTGCLVKCGCIETAFSTSAIGNDDFIGYTYKPMAFNIVTIGPVATD